MKLYALNLKKGRIYQRFCHVIYREPSYSSNSSHMMWTKMRQCIWKNRSHPPLLGVAAAVLPQTVAAVVRVLAGRRHLPGISSTNCLSCALNLKLFTWVLTCSLFVGMTWRNSDVYDCNSVKAPFVLLPLDLCYCAIWKSLTKGQVKLKGFAVPWVTFEHYSLIVMQSAQDLLWDPDTQADCTDSQGTGKDRLQT